MRNFLALTLLLTSTLLLGQDKGSIAGKLIDKEYNNEPLAFANILIKGTTTGTTSDIDGSYGFDDLVAGHYTLAFSFVGYELQEVEVTVVANKVTKVDVAMGASSASLDEVVITTTTRKESVAALLLDQKKAVEIKQSIGAQELSRKGVSNVATALTKTTGVSKQEGSDKIYVRGLGDRYNMTTLNGLPLPSNNPSRKNISLDMFSVDIVEFISISKTFNYSNYGDFAGASIDIVSKNYKGNGFVEFGIGFDGNSNALGKNNFYLSDGPNKSGFYNLEFPNNPLASYNFDTSWNKETITPFGTNFSLTGGDSFYIGGEARLSFFLTGNFENNYSFCKGIARGSISTQAIPRKDFTFDSYTYETNTTALGNLVFKINSGNSINFNALMINSSNQSLQDFKGVIDIFDNAPNGGGLVSRSNFERTTLFINQLLGTHHFNNRLDLDWGLSYNIVNNFVPDRKQFTLVPVDNNNIHGPLKVSDLSTSDNHRFFQNLNEHEMAANLQLSYKFAKRSNDGDAYKGKASFGYSGRFKQVDFDATQFNFRINRAITTIVDPDNMNGYFNQNSLNLGLFTIETFRGPAGTPGVLKPQIYMGSQLIHAAFGAVEYKFSSKFTGIFGLRGEYIFQKIEWKTSLDPIGDKNDFDRFEFLPTVSLKYALNDTQNLRFAASKTYTLPQFKERAPFQFEEVTRVTFGNPDLMPSTDYNLDLKWELFPSSDELISATIFGKYIQNPINDVTVASATNDVSYVNTGEKAVAVGAELELRKNIFKRSQQDELANTLSVGFNASYMQTDQDFDSEKVINETSLNVFFTEECGKLTGASDLLLNADISYLKAFGKHKNLLATVSYTYFSDRISSIGTNGRGDKVDKAVGTLNFIFKTEIDEHLGLGFKLNNLLNPEVKSVQKTQNVIVESYKKGIDFSFSMAYKF